MKYQLCLTSNNPDLLKDVILATQNPAIPGLSKPLVTCGPVQLTEQDPVRMALEAYRTAHRVNWSMPYKDCTCALCRAADKALNQKI